ncbi:MAG: Glutathione S-transferase [Parcubacteria group bacterium GW2011_GWA2_43_13]|nr:MAG: Glutathione S-transferase [Parcubacteria group bacterium GW2011_GWA2_43_13]
MEQSKKMLELYQFEECPYCKKVRTALTDLGMTYIIHNVPRNLEERDELEKVSGQRYVPVLVDPNTDTVIADDDEKAVEYLTENYENENVE